MIQRLRALVGWARQIGPRQRERRALRRLYAAGVSRQARIIGAERILLGRNVRVHPFATIDCRLDPFLGDDRLGDSQVVIGDDCVIASQAMLLPYGGRIELGANCTVNPFTVLYGSGGLSIGANTRIACHSVVVPSNHVFADPTVPIYQQGVDQQGISIGHDVWIGANVTILDGVAIGNGCVVAAQSVVTTSIDPCQVVAGVPARSIKTRGAESSQPVGPPSGAPSNGHSASR